MAAKRKPRRSKGDPVVDELDAIKRLMILQLITSGIQSKDIASALGVDKSILSRLVPVRKVKRRLTKD